MKMVALLLLASLTVNAQTPASSPTPTPEPATPTAVEAVVEAAPAPTPEPTPIPAPAPVPTKFNFAGDLRLRYQRVTDGLKSERGVPRIQARFGTIAEVTPELKAQIRLMTGNDAASGNQTMGERSTLPSQRRTFGLDLAFLDYAPAEESHVLAGRMPGPFQFGGKSQLLLDRDIALEGVASKTQFDLDRHRINLNLGGFILREQFDDGVSNKDETDNMLYGAQLIYRFEQKDVASVTLGVGQFGWTGMKEVFTSAGSPKTTPYPANGNSVNPDFTYMYNFDQQQLFWELKGRSPKVDLWLFTLPSIEAGIFQEAIVNTSADRLNRATADGISLALKPITITYARQTVEKDAVIGLFSDSDWAGGVTSSEGTVRAISWAVSKQVAITYTEWKTKAGVETPVPTDYLRNHLDLQVVF